MPPNPEAATTVSFSEKNSPSSFYTAPHTHPQLQTFKVFAWYQATRACVHCPFALGVRSTLPSNTASGGLPWGIKRFHKACAWSQESTYRLWHTSRLPINRRGEWKLTLNFRWRCCSPGTSLLAFGMILTILTCIYRLVTAQPVDQPSGKNTQLPRFVLNADLR